MIKPAWNIFVRSFGFCSHEWLWSTEIIEFGNSDFQRAICERCGKVKQCEIGRSARRGKYEIRRTTKVL